MDIKYKNLTKAEVKCLKDYNVDDEVIQSINAIQRKRHGADRFCADTYVDTYVDFFSKLNQKYNISISKFEKLYDDNEPYRYKSYYSLKQKYGDDIAEKICFSLIDSNIDNVLLWNFMKDIANCNDKLSIYDINKTLDFVKSFAIGINENKLNNIVEDLSSDMVKKSVENDYEYDDLDR